LHTDPGFTLSIGEDVSVGHQAMLHGCTVGDGSLIGVQAVILNGASIGKNSLVAAGAVVTERKVSATTRLAPRRGRPPCPRPVEFVQHLYGRNTFAVPPGNVDAILGPSPRVFTAERIKTLPAWSS